MSYWFRRPKPDAFGTSPVILSVGPLGGSNLLYSTGVLVTQGSITFTIPTPYRKLAVRAASTHASTLVSTHGTTVATLRKRVAGTTVATITSALNLATGTAKVSNPFVIGSHSTVEADRICQPADVLEVVVVNTGTLVTEPVELYFNVEANIID
ncbi:MAG: hypothetical protein ACR652_24345 [Methylocystis sp.]|uniref:hypothetical protein n=1 Tax=Methylocystis sp. TaxID=1911079 RepID=UPI003DA27309